MPEAREFSILLVEDDVSLRILFRDTLADAGYSVIEASGGNEAYALFQSRKVDAIISDLRMPDGDGAELLKKVRSSDRPGTLFYLVTGYSGLGDDVLSSSGADGVFKKPFDVEAFLGMLEFSLTAA